MASFQAVTADRAGIWKLVQFLHSLLGKESPPIEEKELEFERVWPSLSATLDAVRGTPSAWGSNLLNVFGSADVIYFGGHGDLHAGNLLVPGNHDVVISGDLIAAEDRRKEEPAALSAEQAFERINAAVRQNLQQLKENVEQAREQSKQFFKLTIGFASAGFLVVLGAVLLLLAGQVSGGIVASVASLIPEATAALFFRKDSELRKTIESYNQHILSSQQTLTMIDLSETIKNASERDRIKRDIILRVLDISNETGNTRAPNAAAAH